MVLSEDDEEGSSSEFQQVAWPNRARWVEKKSSRGEKKEIGEAEAKRRSVAEELKKLSMAAKLGLYLNLLCSAKDHLNSSRLGCCSTHTAGKREEEKK